MTSHVCVLLSLRLPRPPSFDSSHRPTRYTSTLHLHLRPTRPRSPASPRPHPTAPSSRYARTLIPAFLFTPSPSIHVPRKHDNLHAHANAEDLTTYHIVYRFNIFSAIMIHLSRRRRHGRMDQTHHSHALPPKSRSFRLLGSMGPPLITSSLISWTFWISSSSASSSASSIFSPYCVKAVFFRFRKQTLCFFFAF